MYDHPQAQYELAVALYTGEGVVENEEEAVSWFELAAKQNHPAACYMLGDCLLDGEGVEVDRGAALEWLVRAAELGHRLVDTVVPFGFIFSFLCTKKYNAVFTQLHN